MFLRDCLLCEDDAPADSAHYRLEYESFDQTHINLCPMLQSMEDVKEFVKHPEGRETIKKLGQQAVRPHSSIVYTVIVLVNFLFVIILYILYTYLFFA